MPLFSWFNKTFLHYLSLGIYSVVLGFLVLHSPFDLFAVVDVPAIQQVEFQVANTDQPAPLSKQNWRSATLPDDWYHSDHSARQIWYQVTLTLQPSESDLWALYLPQVTHNAEVFVNGIWVGRGGDFGGDDFGGGDYESPVSRHYNEPLLFPFSRDMLREGENHILLRVAASFHQQGMLDPFFVAPLSQLEPAYLWKYWLRVDFIRGVTVAMYILAAVLCLFWLMRRQDHTYGAFSLLLFSWASHNLNLFVSQIPVSARLWEAMTMSTLGWAVMMMVFFNHRYVGDVNHRVETFLLFFAIAGLGVFLLPDIGLILTFGARFWNCALVLIGMYSVVYLLQMYHRKKEPDIYLMLLVGIPILTCGFHDILIVNHMLDRSEGLIIQYSIVPAIILFSWFLLRRFIQSLGQAEELAVTLEARVQERGAKIEQQYEQLSKLQSERTLANERERIMRDMHDGIGGQLMSLFSALKPHKDKVLVETRDKIQSCIDDLRIVINSLDPALSDLPVLFGMMRSRFENQLKTADIRLVWAISDMDQEVDLGPENSLHLLRILQEAVANCIKHSNASELTISVSDTAENQAGIEILMKDNGNGFNSESIQSHGGRGLKNIRYRAAKMGAQLSYDSGACGTVIRLVVHPAGENKPS